MTDATPPATTRTRSYEYEAASFDPAALMRLSGLDYMRALAAGEIGSRPSIAATIGMGIPYDIEHGSVRFDAEPSDFVLNPLGTVHGGFAATVLDSALGVAAHTVLPAAHGYTTAELKVNYTRAILPTTGTLTCTGTVVHAGRRMVTTEARLVGKADGKLYAHGSATLFVMPMGEAA
tara:strand:+ start:414 stop:944 length:531 start_codon:yes stop_codon:yes gene_type:complete